MESDEARRVAWERCEVADQKEGVAWLEAESGDGVGGATREGEGRGKRLGRPAVDGEPPEKWADPGGRE